MSEDAHPKPKYGLIFLSLSIVTLFEIFYAGLSLPTFVVILGLVGMAIFKALLVAFFYMHLKFEKLLLIVIAFAPLILSIILVVIVGSDIGKPLP